MFNFTNYAKGELNANIGSDATSLTLKLDQGALFPQTGSFRGVIWSSSYSRPQLDTNREFITGTFSSGDTFNIIRAQEGTLAKNWSADDNFALVITAGVLNDRADQNLKTTDSPSFAGLTVDTNTLYVDSVNHRVGIGLTNPAQQLELTQNLRIPNTTSAAQYGIIYKGTTPFIHDFKRIGTDGYNTFVGLNAGNLTMSGATGVQASYNTAVGYGALISNTTGSYNSAIGPQSLYSNTTGYWNTAIGFQSLYSNTEGYGNFALGMQSLYSNTTGAYNLALGWNSLHNNLSSHYNLALGFKSLFSNKNGGYNLAIGYGTDFFIPSAISGASAVSGSGLEIGNYLYCVSFILDGKETALGDATGVTTTSGNQKVDLIGIPTYSGPKNCTARKIYRTKVNSSIYYYVATLNDNTTTTYSDTTPDASLSATHTNSSYCMMLGYGAKAFESNQMVIGSDDKYISQLYLGEGVYATSPHNITINATGGQGTNNPGASLILAGGKGTGSGAGGDIIFQSAPAGSSGSLANSLTDRMKIKSDGSIYINSLTRQTAGGLVVEYDTSTGLLYAETSSETHKENIKNVVFNQLNDPLNLLNLKLKSWTDKATKKQEFGYLADDVAKIYPELAVIAPDFEEITKEEKIINESEDENGEKVITEEIVYKTERVPIEGSEKPVGIKLTKLPVLVLELIKKQQAEIEELKTRIEVLEK